jgi:integrase
MSVRVFSSFLAEQIQEYLVFKRACGYAFQSAEDVLRNFDRFLVKHPHDRDLQDLIGRWLAAGKQPRAQRTVSKCFGKVRLFCLFLRRRDPDAYVPPRDWLSAPKGPKGPRFLPHIFSNQEIRTLLRAMERRGRSPLRSITYKTLVLVLYCTGLRFGEVVRLKLGDVDLQARTFFIVHSKRKSRWVPFNDGLARAVRRYLLARNERFGSSAESPLFVTTTGNSYAVDPVSKLIRKALRDCGMKPAKGRQGPRPYDLRHTFAVHTLTRWYTAGVDIHARLPWLSAYMGHDNILGTEKYLQATPELLQLVSRRFAAYFFRRREAHASSTNRSPAPLRRVFLPRSPAARARRQ